MIYASLAPAPLQFHRSAPVVVSRSTSPPAFTGAAPDTDRAFTRGATPPQMEAVARVDAILQAVSRGGVENQGDDTEEVPLRTAACAEGAVLKYVSARNAPRRNKMMDREQASFSGAHVLPDDHDDGDVSCASSAAYVPQIAPHVFTFAGDATRHSGR
ncbi:hypothetical protein B0H11DRAFT_2244484 [Mycena galericulata]|nr:hypothetical protein B0H11DRAFT_2244484 [Mycena galericulata]